MHIGVDFDNTIVTYDNVFYKHALRLGLIQKEVIKNKQAIRDAIRGLPGGNDRWTELQGLVYGKHMDEVEIVQGVERFFEMCKKNSLQVSIISHKSVYPAMGPRVNLQEAAKKWLKSKDFFLRFGLGENDVIFEESIEGKLEQIARKRCAYFIDDLEEVLAHPGFPEGVRKILYSQQAGGDGLREGILRFKNWDEITRHFLDNLVDTSADTPGLFDGLLKSEFGEEVTGIQKIPGGINSEVFKITTKPGNLYFGKIYRQRKDDNRQRLVAEFYGLTFLWENGIRNIPQPLLADQKHGLAVYKFIRGLKLGSAEIAKTDIDQAADFVSRIHLLTGLGGADSQPIASEACFSIREYIDCVDGRIDRLRNIMKENIIFNLLRACMENEFIPFFATIKEEIQKKAKKLGINIDDKLPKRNRTLSASDFGFHNAIKAESGKLFFFDFEYYGWDDPAKMIADFCLQPEIPIPSVYREYFFEKIRKGYREGKSLERRISLIYPILGLKWCLIMLNPFLRFDGSNGDEDIYLKNLAKAKGKLQEVKLEMSANVFPFCLL